MAYLEGSFFQASALSNARRANMQARAVADLRIMRAPDDPLVELLLLAQDQALLP